MNRRSTSLGFPGSDVPQDMVSCLWLRVEVCSVCSGRKQTLPLVCPLPLLHGDPPQGRGWGHHSVLGVKATKFMGPALLCLAQDAALLLLSSLLLFWTPELRKGDEGVGSWGWGHLDFRGVQLAGRCPARFSPLTSTGGEPKIWSWAFSALPRSRPSVPVLPSACESGVLWPICIRKRPFCCLPPPSGGLCPLGESLLAVLHSCPRSDPNTRSGIIQHTGGNRTFRTLSGKKKKKQKSYCKFSRHPLRKRQCENRRLFETLLQGRSQRRLEMATHNPGTRGDSPRSLGDIFLTGLWGTWRLGCCRLDLTSRTF